MKKSQKETLDFLAEAGPITLAGIAEHFGVSKPTMWDRVKRLHDADLAHVVRYDRNLAPHWAAGPGHSARQDTCRMFLLAALAVRPRTVTSLANESGYNRTFLQREITTLYTLKKIHVADYTRNTPKGPWIRVFAIGHEPDAKKPRALRSSEKSRAYRVKPRNIGLASLLDLP